MGNSLFAKDSRLQTAGADDENTEDGSVKVTTYSLQSSRQEILISGTASLNACSSYTAGGIADCTALIKAINSNSTLSTNANDTVGVVLFDPIFSALLNQNEDVRVLITPTSPVVGNIYVAEKSTRGFVIKELNAQDYGATFDWIFIGKISDGSDNKIEEIIEEAQEQGGAGVVDEASQVEEVMEHGTQDKDRIPNTESGIQNEDGIQNENAEETEQEAEIESEPELEIQSQPEADIESEPEPQSEPLITDH